ncbi:hypothetical protein ANN_09051 [Periplaneta americana]|uniref:Uncharacterized protein n=1 Tax=Periplaneta americana TaxID=6978 RepID=A0ABQ8TMV5_PERAM|nr:hypothetical protein ANN_09051 [Periplaneta americana]
MSPGSNTESYPAFAHIGLRKTNLPRPGIEPGPIRHRLPDIRHWGKPRKTPNQLTHSTLSRLPQMISTCYRICFSNIIYSCPDHFFRHVWVASMPSERALKRVCCENVVHFDTIEYRMITSSPASYHKPARTLIYEELILHVHPNVYHIRAKELRLVHNEPGTEMRTRTEILLKTMHLSFIVNQPLPVQPGSAESDPSEDDANCIKVNDIRASEKINTFAFAHISQFRFLTADWMIKASQPNNNRRADIIIIDRQKDKAVILDPTIHFEMHEQQPQEVQRSARVLSSVFYVVSRFPPPDSARPL